MFVYQRVPYGGFLSIGVSNSWLVYTGKSHEIDDLGVLLLQETIIYNYKAGIRGESYGYMGSLSGMWEYPLVTVHILNWKIIMLFMGKLTILIRPFSIAM